MRVLHIYKAYYPESVGGIERSIKNIIDGTNKLGSTSRILTTYKKTKNKKTISFKQNFEIFSTPFSYNLFLNFKKITKSFDILHYHHPWPFMDFLHILLNIKTPSILTYHSDVVRQKNLKLIYKPLMNLFFSKISRIVCSSQNYLKTSSDLKKFKTKTSVIPFGINIKDYKINNIKLKLYKKNFGSDFIIFVGALRYYKGLEYLLKAVSKTNYKLLIVGKGKMFKSVNTYIKKNNINNVTILRNIKDTELSCLIKLSKCLVLPSHLRSEAFGFALLEGLMFRKPLVSCNIGTGTSFINIDKKTGFVVKPKSSRSIRLALNKIYNKNFNEKKFQKNCKIRFEKYFTQDKMVSKYFDLYKSMINTSNRTY